MTGDSFPTEAEMDQAGTQAERDILADQVSMLLKEMLGRLDKLEERCQSLEIRVRNLDVRTEVIPVAEYLPRG